MARLQDIDPKGLIGEAYRMEGIAAPECRSIFLDWLLGLPNGTDPVPSIEQLLQAHAKDAPDHPMSAVLTEGLKAPTQTGRRGGRRARQSRA